MADEDQEITSEKLEENLVVQVADMLNPLPKAMRTNILDRVRERTEKED